MLDTLNSNKHIIMFEDYKKEKSIPNSKERKNKILLIATYDSFLRSGLAVARAIENATIEIKIRTSVDNQLSTQQLRSILKDEDIPYSSFFLNNYKDINYNQYDVIIISAGNGFNKSFFEFYLSDMSIIHTKILTITLFPGVIFGDIDSIVSRIHGNILLCNNKMDYNIALNIKKLWSLPTQIVHYGFPVMQTITPIKKENIYFFEQVKIPETYIDRMYLITKLVEFSFHNPRESIYIKSRVSLSEKTIHPNKYPLERLLKIYAKNNPVPTNLLFTYDDINICLSKTKMAITLSSTVAFETIYNDIPTVVISDYGLNKKFSNHYFMESGCMLNFSEINTVIPKINIDWYTQMVDFPQDRISILNNNISSYFKLEQKPNVLKSIHTQTYAYHSYQKLNKIPTKKFMQILKKITTIFKFLRNYKRN